MEVRKFEANDSTQRTLLFNVICHGCSDNAGTFIIVAVWSSFEDFQALAMSLAAKVSLRGTGWVAFKQLIDKAVFSIFGTKDRFI